MKVKVAGYKVLPITKYSGIVIFSHDVAGKDFVQVTEKIEVDLPELDEATIAGMIEVQTQARIAELEEKIDTLRGLKKQQEAA